MKALEGSQYEWIILGSDGYDAPAPFAGTFGSYREADRHIANILGADYETKRDDYLVILRNK